VIVIEWFGSVFQIPFPLQVVMDGPTGYFGPRKMVTRVPSVQVHGGFAVLDFPELPGGAYVNGPFGGPLSTVVRELRGLASVEDIRTHFALESGVDLTEWPRAMTVEQLTSTKVITFDLGDAGFEPGTTYSYVFTPRGHVLHFSPTHYLNFQWDRLVFGR